MSKEQLKKKYEIKKTEVYAVLYDGSLESKKEIMKLAKHKAILGTRGSIEVKTANGFERIKVGSFVVKQDVKKFEVLSEKDFNRKYKEVKDTE